MQDKRRLCVLFTVLMCLGVTGCSKQPDTTINMTEQVTEDVIGTTGEIVLPTSNGNIRTIPDELPKASEAPENPGNREHFSFLAGDNTYVFTETDTLWLYNQSQITTCKTQFLLNVKGKKVVIAEPDTTETVNLGAYTEVYTDDVVTIYRTEDTNQVKEEEEMYLTVYGVTYQVLYWQDLVSNRSITLKKLYESLAQMGTAIQPAEKTETLSNVITGMGAEPVFEDYTLAFREGITCSGYVFCSPNSSQADYDNVMIFMSMIVPEWNDNAVLTIEKTPDFEERLEDTGETFDGHPILVDYIGELKYFILGEDGTCVTLNGIPGNADTYTKNYSAREAAYIFELFLTK